MYTIRFLQPSDNLDEVLALCREFFAEYESHHREFFDTDNLTDADIKDRFLASLKQDASATVIAIENDAIVGYASVAIHDQPRFYKVKKVGAISALMVKPECRRQGIGALLLEGARDYFRSKGIRYFTFYTAAANVAAVKLYDKLGFERLHFSFLGKV